MNRQHFYTQLLVDELLQSVREIIRELSPPSPRRPLKKGEYLIDDRPLFERTTPDISNDMMDKIPLYCRGVYSRTLQRDQRRAFFVWKKANSEIFEQEYAVYKQALATKWDKPGRHIDDMDNAELTYRAIQYLKHQDVGLYLWENFEAMFTQVLREGARDLFIILLRDWFDLENWEGIQYGRFPQPDDYPPPEFKR